MYTGSDNSARRRRHKIKSALRSSKQASGSTGGVLGGDNDSDNDDANDDRVGFSLRRGSKGIFGDSPRREYKTDDVGRLRDLVGAKRKVGGEVRLKVECVRPLDSVVTTVSSVGDLYLKGAKSLVDRGKER